MCVCVCVQTHTHTHIYIYIYIHTHTHITRACTRIYIYIYIYIGIRYPDEPLRRNYSRLVPDSLINYRYYFALLSIEHFLHCILAARTVFFFFLPTNCMSFDFFSIGMTRLAFSFFFFSNIYFFPMTVIRCIFSSSNHLPVFFLTIRAII